MEDFIAEISVQLKEESVNNLKTRINNLFNNEVVKIPIDIDTNKLDSIDRVIKKYNKKSIDIGVKESNKSNKGTKPILDDYKKLESLAKEITRKSVTLKGLDSSSKQAKELTLQIKNLNTEYDTLYKTASKNFTPKQSNKLNELTGSIRTNKYREAEAKNIDKYTTSFDKRENDYQNLVGYKNVNKLDENTNKVLNELTHAHNKLQESLKNENVSYQDLSKSYYDYISKLREAKTVTADLPSNSVQKLEEAKNKFSNSMTDWLYKTKNATPELIAQIRNIRGQLKDADATSLDNLKKEFEKIKIQANLVGKSTDTFVGRLKHQFQTLSGYFTVSALFIQGKRFIDGAIENVKNIDTEMVELKKVTDETDIAYSNFLENASKKAPEIGTTIKDYISSTADFARLGYNITDASKLAESANIYNVVGDQIENIDEATNSIISTMKAFGVEASNSMSIVDKFNEVGNNFAISSGGIGTALQRAASSLATGGNTLDQSIAMITSANEIVQDSPKVGNGLRTISLRIRGMSTELKEAGEDVSDMVDSVPKLRQEIINLSGVDIMKDENTFKSTYEILDELSKKWKDLSDTQKAAITEDLAGKNRANIFNALIDNFDNAREALKTSQDSEGSAIQEHEKWLTSIDAKINQFKANLESLSQTFMSSDFLKNALDILMKIVDTFDTLLDKVGTLPVLLGSIGALGSMSGLLPKILSTQGNGFFNVSGKNGFEFGLSRPLVSDANIVLIDEYNNALKKFGNGSNELNTVIEQSDKNLQNYFKNLNGAPASVNQFGNSLLGLKVKVVATSVAINLLNTAIIAGVTALASWGISALVKQLDKEYNEMNDAIDKADKAREKSKKKKEESAQLDELIEKYKELSKQERTQEVKDELLKTQKSINALVDDEKSKVDLVNSSYEHQLKLLDDIRNTKNEEVLQKDNTTYYANVHEGEELKGQIAYRDFSGLYFGNKKGAEYRGKISDVELKALGKNNSKRFSTKSTQGLVSKIAAIGSLGLSPTSIFAPLGPAFRGALGYDLGKTFNKKTLDLSDKSLKERIKILEEMTASMERYAEQHNKFNLGKSKVYTQIQSQLETYQEQDKKIKESAQTYTDELVNSIFEPLQKQDNKNDYNNLKNLTDFYNNGLKQVFEQQSIKDILANKNLSNNEIKESIKNWLSQNQEALKISDEIFDNFIYTNFESDDNVITKKQKEKVYKKFNKVTSDFFNELSNEDKEILYKVNVDLELDSQSYSPERLKNQLLQYKIDNINIGQALDLTSTVEAVKFLENGLTNINTLINSETTGIGLKSSDIETIKGYESALEYVNGTIQLNRDKVKELAEANIEEAIAANQATKEHEQAKYMDNVSSIELLNEQLRTETNLTDESRNAIYNKINALREQNNNILTNCDELDLLNSSLQDSIGLYQQWKDSQGIAESGDMFNDTITALTKINDVLNNKESDDYGKVGREDYQASLDLIIPDNVNKQNKNAVKKYLDSIKNLFTFDEEGNRSGLELQNFINSSLDKGLLVFNKKKNEYKIAGQTTMEDFANGLNLSMPLVQAIFGELQEYGWKFDWKDESYQSYGDAIVETTSLIQDLQSKIDVLTSKKERGIHIDDKELKKLKKELVEANKEKDKLTKKSEINFFDYDKTTNKIKDTKKEISNIKEALSNSKEGSDTFNINTKKLEKAESKLKKLRQHRNELKKPTEVEIQLISNKYDEKIKEIDNKIESYKSRPWEVKGDLNSDELKEKVDKLEKKKKELEEKKASIDVRLNSKKAEKGLDDLKKKTDDKEIDIDVNSDEANKKLKSISDYLDNINKKKNINITINRKNSGKGNNGGSSGGEDFVNGTVSGDAKAKGDWSVNTNNEVLTGELGRELVVNPYTGKWYTVGDNGAEFVKLPRNAIVFNHRQTEELLSKGFTSSRATALVNGNAFVTGGGSNIEYKKTKKKKKKTTNTNTNTNTDKNKDKSTDKALTNFQNWLSKLFDWIEVRIARIQTKIDNAIKKAELYASRGMYSKASTQYKNAINNTEKLIQTNNLGATRYMKQANIISNKAVSNGLVSNKQMNTIKKRVANGTIDISKYNEKTQEVIKSYQEYYEKAIECSNAVTDLTKNTKDYYEALYNLPIEKMEKAIEKLSKKMDVLDSKYEVADGFKARNKILDEETNNQKKQNAEYQKASKTANKNLDKAKKKNAKDIKALDKTQDKLLSDRGLSKSQKKDVKNNKLIDTKGLKGKALKDAKAYNKALIKQRESSLAVEEAEKVSTNAKLEAEKQNYNYTKALRDNTYAKLENIKADYDSKNNIITSKENRIEADIEKKKAEGQILDRNNYKELIDLSKNLVSQKKKEYNEYLKQYNLSKDNLSQEDNEKALAELENLQQEIINAERQNIDYISDSIQVEIDNEENLINKLKTQNNLMYDFNKKNENINKQIEETREKYDLLIEQENNAIKKATLRAEKEEAIRDLLKEQVDNIKEYYNMIDEWYSTQRDVYSAHYGDYYKAKGIDTYKSRSNVELQEALYQRTRSDILKDEAQNIWDTIHTDEWGKYVDGEFVVFESKYKEYMSSMSDYRNALAEFYKSQALELESEYNAWLNLYINPLTDENEKLDNKISELQAINNYKNAKGLRADKMYYTELYNISKREISNLEQINTLYREQQALYDVESTKYKELQKLIDDTTKSIINAQQSQVEWRNAILNLPFEDIETLLNNLDSIKNNLKTTSDLLSALGEDAPEKLYFDRISNNMEILEEYEKERTLALRYYRRALSDSENVYDGKTSEEWLIESRKYDDSINQIKIDIEEIRDALRDDVYWRTFEKAHNEAKRFSEILSGIKELIDSDIYFNKNGELTKWGVSQISILVSEYENARTEVQNYSNDIKNLNKLYQEGYYTQDEYIEKLNELQSSMLDSASNMKSGIDSIISMYKELGKAELDYLFELIDARNDALSSKKEYYDLDKTLTSKNKEIQSLKAQIDALNGIATAEAKVKKARLEAELSEAEEDLNDTINSHMLELSQNALNELKNTLQDAYDDKWDKLWENLNNISELMKSSNELTSMQSSLVKDTLTQLLNFYGIDTNATGLNNYVGYAKGSKHINKSKLAWTNEKGNEIIIRKSDGAILTPLKRGDSVIPNNLSNNLFEWGKYNPDDMMNKVFKSPTLPSVMNPSTNVEQHFDSLLNVEGNVDSTVVTDIKQFAKEFYQGSYEYTVKAIVKDAKKSGIKA